ncbi:MAG: diacylglycerol kinase family protein [Candidatus Fermentibacteraceae bacterium]|nr:diacylglycerol kinase family protein [Candidatus Fermentibacteraceae bacterium]MBN2609219.1 diacylglycerol kinase family protein [Candidatus Fermentibacteraceae bacterium]
MKKRFRSFKYAMRGIWTLLATQSNARIHLAALVTVVAAGLIMDISLVEWALITLSVALVFSAEAMNSALEFLADHTAPQWHDSVQKAKDLAAGAVLLAALGALVVGLLVFVPHF